MASNIDYTQYKLKDLLVIKNGRDHKLLPDGDYPVLGSGGVMRYVDAYLYDKPSILLPRKGTLDNIQYADKPFWTVDTLYYTEVNESIADAYYLYNYLNLLDLNNLDTGTGVPSMTFDSYYNILVSLPNIKEQQKISAVLSKLNQKIELNRSLNHNLEAMAKQLYDYWFVQFDFPNAEGKPYKSSGGKMVWNEKLKREIPEGWDLSTIGISMPIITGKEDANFSTKNGKYKFFTCSKEILQCDVPAFNGDAVLLSGNGDIHTKYYSGEFNAYQRTYVLIPSDCSLFAVTYFACSYEISRLLSGTSGSIIKFITKGMIETIPLLIPHDKELLLQLNLLLKKVLYNRQEIESLTKQRDELLPLLMNGQATVNYDLANG